MRQKKKRSVVVVCVHINSLSAVYFLRSHTWYELSLKPSCANIGWAAVKVEVALDSLINGLHGPLSGKRSYGDILGSKIAIYQKGQKNFDWKKAENTKISPEGLLIWRKIAKKHYVGAPKKFVKPHNVIKVLIFQFWHTPIVFFCKIAIFKNSHLCSDHIYNVNGVSITSKNFISGRHSI